MKPIFRTVFALALTIAAPAALLSRPAPARACGSYGDMERSRVRSAALAHLHEKRPAAEASVSGVVVSGTHAKALVHFTRHKNASPVAQVLWLDEKSDGKWAVISESYPFSPEVAEVVFASL